MKILNIVLLLLIGNNIMGMQTLTCDEHNPLLLERQLPSPPTPETIKNYIYDSVPEFMQPETHDFLQVHLTKKHQTQKFFDAYIALMEGIDPVNTLDVLSALLRVPIKKHDAFIKNLNTIISLLLPDQKLLSITYLSLVNMDDFDTMYASFNFYSNYLPTYPKINILAFLSSLSIHDQKIFRKQYEEMSIGRVPGEKKLIFQALMQIPLSLLRYLIPCLENTFQNTDKRYDVKGLDKLSKVSITDKLLLDFPQRFFAIRSFLPNKKIEEVLEWSLHLDVTKKMLDAFLYNERVLMYQFSGPILLDAAKPHKSLPITESVYYATYGDDLKICILNGLKDIKNIRNKEKIGEYVKEIFGFAYEKYFFDHKKAAPIIEKMIRYVAECEFNEHLCAYIEKFKFISLDEYEIAESIYSIKSCNIEKYTNFALKIFKEVRYGALELKALRNVPMNRYNEFYRLINLFFKNKKVNSEKCAYLIFLSNVDEKYYSYFYNFYQHNDVFFQYVPIKGLNETFQNQLFKDTDEVKIALIALHEEHKGSSENPNQSLFFEW